MITLIGSLKGGSGKSTVTFNLGIWLARADTPVMLYDIDPQSTLTDALDVRREEKFSPLPKVHGRYPKNSRNGSEAAEEVLIDVGTANMQGMKKAIAQADRIVVPVAPSQADIWSAQRFLYMIAGTIEHNQKPPEIIVFLNRADTNPAVRESDQASEALSSLPGIRLLKSRLCLRTAYRRSFSEGLAVFELEPNGRAAEEFQEFARALYPGSRA